MKGTVVGLALIALTSGQAFGQSTASSPAFDIADVHAGSRNPGVGMSGGQLRNGRYELHNATMVDLIRTAYGVDADKVVGGPSWLELDKFTIVAKAPQETTAPALKEMLKSLLAARFKLAVHPDTKEMSAYAMTVVGTHKMKESSSTGGCQPVPQQPEPGVVPIQIGVCKGITMAAFAELLPRIANAYISSPVVDKTALTGGFDFEIRFHGRLQLAQAGTDGISIFDALEKQLGLKLELKTIPASALVVDTVNRTATLNSPEVAKALPPPPAPEFEVASIKPTSPDIKGANARIQPTGLLNVSGMPLKQLVQLAWDINSDDLVDAPKWMEAARFDIVARAFASTTQTDMPPIEIDSLRQMLKTLLVERFQIKSHMEDRPVNGYVLSATEKPRLTKADPSTRTKCQEGPAVAGANDPRNRNPILARLLTCQNMTMAQFAERLMYAANGYVRVPALDSTGIEGGYTFSLNFSPIGAFQGGAGRGGDAPAAPPPSGALSATDPNGAISLPEAVEKQLGLKLELKKRPIPVLVIDSAVEKPVDN